MPDEATTTKGVAASASDSEGLIPARPGRLWPAGGQRDRLDREPDPSDTPRPGCRTRFVAIQARHPGVVVQSIAPCADDLPMFLHHAMSFDARTGPARLRIRQRVSRGHRTPNRDEAHLRSKGVKLGADGAFHGHPGFGAVSIYFEDPWGTKAGDHRREPAHPRRRPGRCPADCSPASCS
jgi:hypothetical protein